MQTLVHELHGQALLLAKSYRASESDLMDILMRIQAVRVFETLGYASMFQYCTGALKLSEAQSYSLITVARKAKEVPALQQKLRSGEIHLSNARRIVPVLTPSNQNAWLEKAATLSQRELERELVKVNPQLAVINERIRPVTEARSELRVGISAELESKLRRVKDVLAQKRGRDVPLEEAMLVLASEFLERHDPLLKAKRNGLVARPVATDGSAPSYANGKRTPTPAAVGHAVNWRDGGQCTAQLPSGKRCQQQRWLSVHHVKPVARGGLHAVGNLQTLCQAHHRSLHKLSPHDPNSTGVGLNPLS